MDSLLNILLTFGFGMLPILEVRGAIPFAVGVLNMPTWQAAFWASLGNITIVAFLLKLLNPATKGLMKHSPWFNEFLTKLFHKTRHKHSLRFNEVGALFLITFVAIPVPMTGAWSGTLIAFLFGVRFWPAFFMISLGVIGAATLVSMSIESLTTLIYWISR